MTGRTGLKERRLHLTGGYGRVIPDYPAYRATVQTEKVSVMLAIIDPLALMPRYALSLITATDNANDATQVYLVT